MKERAGVPVGLIASMLVVGAAVLAGLVFMGGQTSTILSKVGAAIPERPAAPGEIAVPAPTAEAGSADGPQVAEAGGSVPALLIVRTGDLQLEVAHLDAAIRDGDAGVIRVGGYVSDSTRVAKAGAETATVTYRIPSARWGTTLDTLHGLATRVIAEQVRTEEVSGQVVDLTARIANLRATEAALQAIMAKAAKIADVLDVQRQLTTTRGEIEQLVAQKAHLEDQASFGSLTVGYHLPVAPAPLATPAPAKGWDPGAEVERATDRLVRIGESSTTVGIWLAIVGLPLLIAAILATLVSWQLYRLTRWVLRRREGHLSEGV